MTDGDSRERAWGQETHRAPGPHPAEDPRVARWLEQARDARIAGEIEAIHLEVAAAIDRERPLCLASGHCCHFGRFGHDLFVTAIEAAWSVNAMTLAPRRSETPPRAMHRESGTDLGLATVPATTPSSEHSCPWLDGRLCGARPARPLGCRTFFCDPRARSWSEPLHERLHGRLRDMHQRFDIIYHYDEWLRMLSLFGARAGTERAAS